MRLYFRPILHVLVLISISCAVTAGILYTARHVTKPGSETSDEVNTATDQFVDWCQNLPVNGICTTNRAKFGEPWSARFYRVVNGRIVAWEEEGFPRLLWAVLRLEHDVAKHPNGYAGKFSKEF